MDLLSWILIVILCFYLISWITRRFFLPFLLRYIAKRLQNKMMQHFNQTQNTTNSSTPHDLKTKKNKTSANTQVGEYIDFEEIK